MRNIIPIARSHDIVVQQLADETLICDLRTNRVFCLNRTASEVWKLCNGRNDINNIIQTLTQSFNSNATDDLVWVTLDKLSNLDLLEESSEIRPFKDFQSRRNVIKRIGITSMIALPLISVVISPTAVLAQSGIQCNPGNPNPADCPCSSPVDCLSGCCLENYPDSPICGPTFGQEGCFCSNDTDCDTNNFECCAPSNPVCNPGC